MDVSPTDVLLGVLIAQFTILLNAVVGRIVRRLREKRGKGELV